jgi:hypothetical protein
MFDPALEDVADVGQGFRDIGADGNDGNEADDCDQPKDQSVFP